MLHAQTDLASELINYGKKREIYEELENHESFMNKH